jgi:protein-S-isoprenylcysteine O-methyltransferase Ste14
MTPRLRSIVATVILVACMLALYLLHHLIGRGAVALALQALAVLLMVWARLTFGVRSFNATANPTAGGLVTTGPYRYWRHPIYAAILLFLWAGVLSNPATIAIALGVVATLATAVRIHAEETMLRSTFAEYDAYAARTKRVIPFVF